ncbi:MAG TPA: hypothetical protein VNM69_16630 [Bacillus sp. (in: firmicutes)]|uniref:hypothetical protein n=1 Tax=Bacillus litorisediminis TaxID=2922713 RepID=UPI001FAEDC19|nr:hypothetical protein [Bacillus litorisediminis]HWO77492.1 hypothetical protein [Bacillus sp. (in: firmicutes)]
MIVSCTNTTISAAEASEIARQNCSGLFNKLFSAFRRNSSKANALQAECIYYPYWVIHYHLSFSNHVESMFIVVDGFTGSASIGKGLPAVNQVEVEKSKLVQCSFSLVKAVLLANDFLTDWLIFKQKRLPSFRPVDFLKLYKPHFIYSCENGSKLLYKAIDAETGERNYSLDTHYSQLLFEEERSSQIWRS